MATSRAVEGVLEKKGSYHAIWRTRYFRYDRTSGELTYRASSSAQGQLKGKGRVLAVCEIDDRARHARCWRTGE